jgi:trimeric autotransporter adhesin
MPIKRILLLLFIVTTFFAKVGHAQLSILPLTNTTKRTIVVMGSSSAYGWKASVPDSTWVNRLQKDLDFYGRGDTIINLAMYGYTTYDCLPTGSTHPGYADAPDSNRNVTKALSYNPTFVIISLPTNDIADGYTDTETLGNYTTITNALIAAHVPFILTGTQPRNLATDAGCSTAFDGSSVCLSTGGLSPTEQADLNTFNGALAAQYPAGTTPYNTPVVNNFLTLLSASATNFEVNPAIGYGDGIHYVDAGHRIVYDTMANFQYYKDLVCFTQTITMGTLTKTIGDPDFAPGSASSSLPLAYTSSDPTVATIVAGKVHIVGLGSCTITADQAGNQHYLAAPSVGVTLTVNSTSGPATTYDWTGAVSSDWKDVNNWQSTTSGTTINPAMDYPGDAVSTNIVNIGVNVDYTNNPVIATSLPSSVASLTFGDRLITGSGTATDSLTINTGATITVDGQVLQKHTTAGVLNSGNTAVVNAIQTYIKGGGTINCGSLAIGDSTTPSADGVVNITKMELGSPAGGSTVAMNVTGNLILNTQSRDNAGGTQILSINDAQFSFAQGTLTIGGQIQLTDGGATSFTGLFQPASVFSVDLYNNADSPVLNLQNANALSTQLGNLANKIDFYNVAQAGGTGIATVNYTGTNSQEIYNHVTGATVDNIIDNNGAAPPDGVVYENLGFAGSGTKTVDAPTTTGTLVVGGVVTLAAGTETVDLSTNNSALVIYADFSAGSGTTFNCGTRPVTIGGSFTNAGTCNFDNALLTFNAGDIFETLTTVNPQVFTNVAFTGGGLLTMAGGSFLLKSTGVLTMSNNSQLATGGNLTLISDASGSATIAAIPTGCSITGNVNVQRYVPNHRAYRLASSPVYSSTTGSNNIFSLNYITRAIYTTGTTGIGGGFDKSGHPTIYLYRENLAPQFTTFLNSNFRGVNDITDTLNYQVDVDGGPFNLPVGNGYMFYYRGSRRQDSLAALTKPGAAATTDTLTATGLLNQGKITVSDWYTPASSNLGWTSNSGIAAVEGTNLVGNPYASSIDWDQYSNTDPSAGIYAPNVGPFSYQLIPSGAQGSGNYGVYQAGTPSHTGTNGSTNIIASGVGFFVQATNASAQLTFNESAKTDTQAVVGSTLFMATHVTTQPGDQFIRLRLAKDSINSDENIIRFDKGAVTSFNYMEDARYRSGTGIVSLSSVSSDNVALAINKTPLPNNKQVLQIPLKLNTSTDGIYALKLAAINKVPLLYDVWLMDAYTKDSINMRSNPSYNFNIARADTNTMGSKRFTLLIRENPAYAYRLLSFIGRPTSHMTQVQLDWTTENEQNYTNFTVERSTDNGKTFNVIGSFISSGLGTYSLFDKNPWVGENVYRLKQEDIDNNITYSNNVYINVVDKSNRVVCLYPNPTKNLINLTINAKTSDSDAFNITVSNSSGMVVRTAKSTQSTWETGVSELLTGTYLIRVVNAKDNKLVGEAKFVKL